MEAFLAVWLCGTEAKLQQQNFTETQWIKQRPKNQKGRVSNGNACIF